MCKPGLDSSDCKSSLGLISSWIWLRKREIQRTKVIYSNYGGMHYESTTDSWIPNLKKTLLVVKEVLRFPYEHIMFDFGEDVEQLCPYS